MENFFVYVVPVIIITLTGIGVYFSYPLYKRDKSKLNILLCILQGDLKEDMRRRNQLKVSESGHHLLVQISNPCRFPIRIMFLKNQKQVIHIFSSKDKDKVDIKGYLLKEAGESMSQTWSLNNQFVEIIKESNKLIISDTEGNKHPVPKKQLKIIKDILEKGKKES